MKTILVEAFETSTRDGKTEYYYRPQCPESKLILSKVNADRKQEGKADIKTISASLMNTILIEYGLAGIDAEIRIVKTNNLVRCKQLVDGQILKPIKPKSRFI